MDLEAGFETPSQTDGKNNGTERQKPQIMRISPDLVNLAVVRPFALRDLLPILY